MWLKLELEGVKIELQIKVYQPSNRESWDYQWCDVDFSFIFPGCIDYARTDDEVMLSCEVEELERKINDLINGKLTERETVELIEPDFIFVFIPSYNMVEAGEYTYADPGCEMSAAVMEWKINLWNDGLTDNCFSITFDIDDLRVFRDYLSLVMRKLDKTSPEIKKHIDDGKISI